MSSSAQASVRHIVKRFEWPLVRKARYKCSPFNIYYCQRASHLDYNPFFCLFAVHASLSVWNVCAIYTRTCDNYSNFSVVSVVFSSCLKCFMSSYTASQSNMKATLKWFQGPYILQNHMCGIMFVNC